jgi:dephospho-CoA kinase
MVVICLTGMPGSGKGEASDHLHQEKGLPVIRMGDIVWDIVKEKGLPLTPQAVGEVANKEREAFGNDIWARRCVDRVRSQFQKGFEDVIIDGVRTPAEVAVFKKAFDTQFYVIAIFTSKKKRFERINARKRTDDTNTLEDFEKRDLRELGWGLGNIIATADIMIMNEGDLLGLKNSVMRTYEELKKGG